MRLTLREKTRAVMRDQIADVALGLFAEHGFDQVTVEQIAAAAGISARSFNRYFPTKEDAALGDVERWGQVLHDAMNARPADEAAWTSMRRSLETVLALFDLRDEKQKRGIRVMADTASLRARNLEKHLAWSADLTPIVAQRLPGPDAELRALALVHAGIACFEAALTTWAEPGEVRSPIELLTRTFDALTET